MNYILILLLLFQVSPQCMLYFIPQLNGALTKSSPSIFLRSLIPSLDFSYSDLKRDAIPTISSLLPTLVHNFSMYTSILVSTKAVLKASWSLLVSSSGLILNLHLMFSMTSSFNSPHNKVCLI